MTIVLAAMRKLLRSWMPDSRSNWTSIILMIAGICFGVFFAVVDGPISIYIHRTSTEWMALLYPIVASFMGANAILMFAYWRTSRHVSLALMSAMIFASECVVVVLLVASAGGNKQNNIDEMRHWLVYARFSLLVFSALHMAACIKLLIRYRRHFDLIEVPKGTIVVIDAPHEAEMFEQDKT